jgi:NADPH:quinone reductase-like Zn-dependent oxidoreductase
MGGPIKAALLSPFVDQEFVMLLAQLTPDDLATIGDLMQEGSVTAIIDSRYPLSEVRAAIEHSEDGHARGKIIICADPEMGDCADDDLP